jgi:malonyl-CoA/methylmalonyl-CoA synthetase
MSENLYHLFESRFPKDRAARFIETADGSVYTYRDLDETSARYANLLRSLGVKKGDRVAVQIDKSPQNVFLALACFRLGAILLPMNTAYQRGEISYFLGDAEPRIFVCRRDQIDAVRPLAEEKGVTHLLTLGRTDDGSFADQSRDLPATFETVEAAAGDVAAILYTSGTTGRSKGAMLTHRNLSSNALTLHRLWGFRPDDVLLHVLPIYHTHGLFVATNTTLVNGTGMIFLDRFDTESVIRRLPRATVLMGVPTFYVRLLADPNFTAETCRSMRLFVSGSAPLLEETFNLFRERTGHAILERYGMTETGMSTSNPLEGERIAGTIGPPLPDVETRICDNTGKPVPAGEIGVLEVRGPNVFPGYWRMPEKTKEEFRSDGFFITGDLSRIDEKGYIHLVGRAKDLIITGGLNVYPKEVEAVIDALHGVDESAVIGLPHPDFGEAVAAVVTRRPDHTGIDEDEVTSRLKGQLAGFKLPKRVFFVEELPRNALGKVQKNVLRDRYRRTFDEAG